MKKLSRRELCVVLPAIAGLPLALRAQVQASEFPAPHSPQPASRTAPANDPHGAPVSGTGTVGVARAISLEQMALRTSANGGESRDIAHGTLATGESVNLHQSMQVVGAVPNPLHVIQHSEFILVREGELEFQHDVAGEIATERVGPGGGCYMSLSGRATH